ncbi:MAG TPA: competence protein ComEA [Ruminiclostridium sp.]|jgi:competence protein ComEA|nr:helix-hairpin-helix domain-containing protein [Clostridiaceae bacterium]HAA24554.1 competence protein ComEA [Ruminiclostridium sp.]
MAAVLNAGPVKGKAMKVNFFERKMKIRRAYIVVAVLILLIVLVLWGWYLKTNKIDVFVVSGGSENNQTQTAENEPAGGSGSTVPDTAEAVSKININTADAESLMSLKGIGAVKADAIIEYRRQNGPFKSIEEIMNVKGIKKATFEKIKDSITVE